MAYTIYVKKIEINRRYRWSRWLRWGRLLQRRHHKIPYVVQMFPPVNFIPRHKKSYNSRFIVDFGGLVESIDRCKPFLRKQFIIKPPH